MSCKISYFSVPFSSIWFSLTVEFIWVEDGENRILGYNGEEVVFTGSFLFSVFFRLPGHSSFIVVLFVVSFLRSSGQC